MKNLRNWIAFLGILALALLFLMMPETPNVFSIFECKNCASSGPYLPLFGVFYFAALVAIALLFPAFPNRHIARGGFVWAVLLAAALTYIQLPHWCPVCLLCHGCNILIWSFWWLASATDKESDGLPFKDKLCIVLFAPIAVVALFSSLNLTFMAYSLKSAHELSATNLKLGDAVPSFQMHTSSGRNLTHSPNNPVENIILNFITPGCPYCKEQLVILNDVAKEQLADSHRIINVSTALPADLVQLAPDVDWVEDTEGTLRILFEVLGYPTLFVVGTNGKIDKIIPGVPGQLKSDLIHFLNLAGS